VLLDLRNCKHRGAVVRTAESAFRGNGAVAHERGCYFVSKLACGHCRCDSGSQAFNAIAPTCTVRQQCLEKNGQQVVRQIPASCLFTRRSFLPHHPSSCFSSGRPSNTAMIGGPATAAATAGLPSSFASLKSATGCATVRLDEQIGFRAVPINRLGATGLTE